MGLYLSKILPRLVWTGTGFSFIFKYFLTVPHANLAILAICLVEKCD